MRLVTCLTTLHDLPLVALAALICALGSWVSVQLYRTGRAAHGRARGGWVFLGAVGAGSTIWCTHFVAMLAYRPAAPVAYGPEATAASLAVAIAASGAALWIGSLRRRWSATAGGAVFGAGVAAMHYTGMAAFAVDGLMLWSAPYVAASVVLSLLFGAGAFRAAARARAFAQRLGAAGLLVLGIVSLHFTGMSALEIVPSAASAGAATSDDALAALALAVAGVGLLVVGAGAASWLLDAAGRDQADARLRHLAETTVDGVAVVQDGRIVEMNAALAALVGRERADLIDTEFAALGDFAAASDGRALVRSTLRRADNVMVPVEVAARREARRGEPPLVVYALRDLRPRLEQERRIAHLARNDSLTDLPNRASFLERLDRAVAARQPGASLALLAVDLDRFKEVNDLHGHAAGDHVLRTLSHRMREALQPGEFLARLGGDEFVALATVGSREEALAFAARLEGPLFSPVAIDEHADAVCGASIGIALYPDDADNPTALMNNADLAMYRAKGTIAQVACFYEEAMDEVVRARRKTMKELRDALQKEQFELRFQVQHAVATGEVTGYEALLRWRHPERGYVPPVEFIPLAEETGLILPIGEWVLRRACEAAAGWPAPHRVAVNLSAVQLGNVDLPRLVHQALIDSGLPPHRLELEITETALILDLERTTHVLRQLKTLGVSVAMDDFGTGYSSLSTLRAFPFDKIKLDKSFVSELGQSPQARAIVKAVLTLGGSLEIPILAEGVETADQLAFLKELGCDQAQGYLLGRPSRTIGGEPETEVRAA